MTPREKPIAAPATTSLRKCAMRYTREMETEIARNKHSKETHVFLINAAVRVNNAHAAIECPEGKLA